MVMTRFILALFGLLYLLSSCVSNSSYKDLKAQYDSISSLNEQIETEFYQTDSLVASVLAHFQEISYIENMINVNLSPTETPRSEQQRIRDNMQQIYERLDKSNEAIDELARQLEAGGKDNQRLSSTIAMMRQQIEQQRANAESFEQEILKRNGTLQVLDNRIRQIRQEAAQIKKDQKLFDELLNSREKHQNRVRYCMGTARDLKDMGILKDRAIEIAVPDLDYFTTADQRELRELTIESDKARLLSIHPGNSYRLSTSGENMKLEILDHEAFWSYTRLLVIQVD